ncbi:4Fe-4S binding protein [Sphaerochaeta sp.]|uniref:4Fe-4S binding protein n=1 Tax=Sphaerochaeta sp. TaxID=1972642 RepID=UPI003D0E2CFA
MKLKYSAIRKYVLIGAAVSVMAAAAGNTIPGTLCNICPVGFLEVSAASRSIPWKMAPWVFAGLFAVYFLGRFFCGWFCSTTLVRKLSGSRCSSAENRYMRYLPYWVLGLSVVVSFFLKFPVFCLFCPIGLFFGFLFAVFKLFAVQEAGLSLIIFPVVIAAEVILFKRWCSGFCPIGAVFSLVSKIPGPKFRPAVNRGTCILGNGGTCSVCKEICPENIKVTDGGRDVTEECTSCMECAEKCPTGSIKFRK